MFSKRILTVVAQLPAAGRPIPLRAAPGAGGVRTVRQATSVWLLSTSASSSGSYTE